MNQAPRVRLRSTLVAAWTATALLVASCGGGGGSAAAPPPPDLPPLGPGENSLTDTTAYSTAPGASLPAGVTEAAAVTKHSITLNGSALAYTAKAGHLVARDPVSNAEEASFFYVAYTADGADPATRPVTFFYNGGPGSASIWLHLGSFGPKRLVTGDPATNAPTPFPLVDNAETLLDVSDLVFVDAIGTGYSQAISPNTNQTFFGVDKDAAAFRDFVVRYLAANGRNASPKFLFGESYGTPRSAGLAKYLEEHGIALNGVVLLSSILNYGSRLPGLDNDYVNLLPSYAAIAWYHNKVANKPATLEPFLTEVRAFARGDYAVALAKGQDLGDAERNAIAERMAKYTGLSVAYLKEANLRVSQPRFRKELLRDQGRTVGRLDARFLGIDVDTLTDSPDYDAAEASLQGAYTAALNTYLFGQLGYRTELEYRPNFQAINRAWDQKHKAPGAERPMPAADTAIDLGRAMRMNPHLRVLSLNGYYDLATPFGGIEYDLKHLWLDPSLRKNIEFAYFESGHMVYVHPDSLAALKARLERFYAE